MQAGSPLHCPQPLNVNVSVKQELSGADYTNCNNLTHLLRGAHTEYTDPTFANGLNCHLVPPAQREILDGEFQVAMLHALYTKTFFGTPCV